VIPCQYRHKWYIAKTRLFGLHFHCRKYMCIFNYFLRNLLRKLPNSVKLYAAVRAISLLRHSRSSKVTEFGTNRKLICDFLLVINIKLPPILYRFRDTAFKKSKIAIFGYPSWVYPPNEGVPLGRYLRKIFIQRSRMAKVPHGIETLPKISIAWVGCTNITDDRQTDGRWHSEHELEFTFAKN